MRVRGTLLLRHDRLLAWRTERGLTQHEAEDAAGIPRGHWGNLERMCFDAVSAFTVDLVASLTGIPRDVVVPPELAGERVQNRVETVAAIPERRLLRGVGRAALPVGEVVPPDRAAMLEEAKEALREAVGNLTERERYVLTSRYDLDGNGRKTLLECGKELGITQERVRSIEFKAIRRLQGPLGMKVAETLP